MELIQIDSLIHPGYSVIDGEEVTLHPEQMEMRRRWEQRMDGNAKREDVLVFYLPSKYAPALVKNPDYLANWNVQEDMARIKAYKDKLGDRLVVLNGGVIPQNPESMRRLIRMHGLTFDFSTLQLNTYGEMLGYCVTVWGKAFQSTLGISNDNYRELADLSITAKQTQLYKAWQAEQLQKDYLAA